MVPLVNDYSTKSMTGITFPVVRVCFKAMIKVKTQREIVLKSALNFIDIFKIVFK